MGAACRTVSHPAHRAAKLETSKPYYRESYVIRRLCGISDHQTTVCLQQIWQRVVSKPAEKRYSALARALRLSKQTPTAIIQLVYIMCGQNVSAEFSAAFQSNATTRPTSRCALQGCSSFQVFVLWAWLLASASMEYLLSICFRLINDGSRSGYLDSPESIEAAVTAVTGGQPFASLPGLLIKYRHWIQSHAVSHPTMNAGKRIMEERSFITLMTRFEDAGLLKHLHDLQLGVRAWYGSDYWESDTLASAKSVQVDAGFRLRLLHVLNAQCKCAGFAPTQALPELTSAVVNNIDVHANPISCVAVPGLQYLLNLGDLPFVARVNGCGELLSAGDRALVSAAARASQTQTSKSSALGS